MLRALAIAFSGVVYFVLSLLIFLPFRMKRWRIIPVCPAILALFLRPGLQACTAQKESRAICLRFMPAY